MNIRSEYALHTSLVELVTFTVILGIVITCQILFALGF